jgi:hypothetical protein
MLIYRTIPFRLIIEIVSKNKQEKMQRSHITASLFLNLTLAALYSDIFLRRGEGEVTDILKIR